MGPIFTQMGQERTEVVGNVHLYLWIKVTYGHGCHSSVNRLFGGYQTTNTPGVIHWEDTIKVRVSGTILPTGKVCEDWGKSWRLGRWRNGAAIEVGKWSCVFGLAGRLAECLKNNCKNKNKVLVFRCESHKISNRTKSRSKPHASCSERKFLIKQEVCSAHLSVVVCSYSFPSCWVDDWCVQFLLYQRTGWQEGPPSCVISACARNTITCNTVLQGDAQNPSETAKGKSLRGVLGRSKESIIKLKKRLLEMVELR